MRLDVKISMQEPFSIDAPKRRNPSMRVTADMCHITRTSGPVIEGPSQKPGTLSHRFFLSNLAGPKPRASARKAGPSPPNPPPPPPPPSPAPNKGRQKNTTQAHEAEAPACSLGSGMVNPTNTFLKRCAKPLNALSPCPALFAHWFSKSPVNPTYTFHPEP